MGQNCSAEDIAHYPVDQFQEDILKNARILTEIASLTYEDFVQHLGELNKLSKKCLDKNGKQLVFAVKKGTDSTILWKGTVKIGCVKVDPKTNSVESYRMINLPEFLKIFKTLKGHMQCIEASERHKRRSESEASCSSFMGESPPTMTASILLEQVDRLNISKTFDKNTECCICLEKPPEVILPCAHSYCLPCIEQWNVNNKTCPICREKLETTDDTWIISEAPDVDEIAAEICSTLDSLTDTSPKHQSKPS